jgi:protein ImuB
VTEFTSAAWKHGLVEGLTASQATARCKDLIIKARSVAQEQAGTDILLQTACAFSPRIEATAPGTCTMELKGLGLENEAASQKYASDILQALAQFYFNAQIGMAATPALARLAARAARPVLFVQDSSAFISGIPLQALEPAGDTLEILSRWGIRTVGEFLSLGKDKIAERLDPAALELFERVATNSIRPLQLVSPPEYFFERMEFENEIETAQPLFFVLHRFVEQLSRRLELIYLVPGEFHLQLGLSSGARYERVFKIPSPTGKIDTLFRMLQTHLENVQTDSPIVSLQLDARPCRPEMHQFGLFETTLRDPNQFADTLARLTALCGSDRVGTPALEATHRPDSFRMQSPDFNAPREKRAPAPARPGLQMRRFRPALAATIEFRNQKPVFIRSRMAHGVIADVRGPFTSSGNWWDHHRWAREEWDVQTVDGTLYRIFRSPEGCFLEGFYD